MFALVVNGAVNAIEATTRRVPAGQWLPLVEDPATYSPYEQQVTAGYTVGPDFVTRHWRIVLPPPTRDEFDQLAEQVATFAAATTDAVTALAAAAESSVQAQVTDALRAVAPQINDDSALPGKAR